MTTDAVMRILLFCIERIGSAYRKIEGNNKEREETERGTMN